MNASTRQLAREKPEPTEGAGPLSPLVLLLIGALGFFGFEYVLTRYNTDPYGYGGDFRSAYAEPDAGSSGEAIFALRCASCHQADGAGVPGTYPPLAGSRWVTEDRRTPIRILLRGLQGEIEVAGTVYTGAMPAFDTLSDEEIASVLSYVRASFGNDAPALTPEEVAEVRAQLQGRAGAWGGAAELEAYRVATDAP